VSASPSQAHHNVNRGVKRRRLGRQGHHGWYEARGAQGDRSRHRARGDHRRVFRSQPIGGQLTPSDETSDVRWACANKLADITTEVFASRLLDGVAYTGPPALRFHDREHLL
jgi:hypothetical protein